MRRRGQYAKEQEEQGKGKDSGRDLLGDGHIISHLSLSQPPDPSQPSCSVFDVFERSCMEGDVSGSVETSHLIEKENGLPNWE